MSIETIQARLAAATPTSWLAAGARGKYGVVGTKDEDGHSYALAVFSAIPAHHRKADAELTAHAPADLAALLKVAEKATKLREGWIREHDDPKDIYALADALDELERLP